MYKIGPRGDPPAELTLAATVADAAVAQALAQGAVKVSFRAYIYGSDHVRTELNQFHRGKCAFCESRILPVSSPHVEHFRPKAGYINETSKELVRPGYYWLAYRWENLLLACPRCNSPSYKGNRFPLDLEPNRAITPAHDQSLEDPLLVDPFLEDPRDYIRFRGGVAYSVDDNQRGKTTIDVLGLNREDLVDARDEHLKIFFSTAEAVLTLKPGPVRTSQESLIAFWQSVSGPYRSCLEDALSSLA